MLGFNGGLIGSRRQTSVVAAPGVWFPSEQCLANAEGKWPASDISAQYWRLTNIEVTATFLELSELQFFFNGERRTGTYSFQVAPSVGVSGSDLGDGSLSQSLYWTASVAENASFWIKIDLGSSQSVNAIKQSRYNTADRHIAAFELQYSDDDTIWSTLGSASGIADPGASTLSDAVFVS